VDDAGGAKENKSKVVQHRRRPQFLFVKL
jgi:hypothetical protein